MKHDRSVKCCSALLVAIAAILAFASCGKNGGNSGKGNADGTIGVTCATASTPLFKAVRESMEDEARKHGYEIVYLDAGADIAKQQRQIKNFVLQKVAAIAVNPADSQALGSSIKEANTSGIPVFTFGAKIDSQGAATISHIGTNNTQGGGLAGQAMTEALGQSGGKVIIIDHRDSEACNERVQGFKKAIDTHNSSVDPASRIEITAELPGGGNRANAFKATEDALETEPGLNGIFAVNDLSGFGAVEALKEATRLKQVKVIAFGGSAAGGTYAAPAQQPDRIGRETIQAIIAHLNGEKVSPNINIPATVQRQASHSQ